MSTIMSTGFIATGFFDVVIKSLPSTLTHFQVNGLPFPTSCVGHVVNNTRLQHLKLLVSVHQLHRPQYCDEFRPILESRSLLTVDHLTPSYELCDLGCDRETICKDCGRSDRDFMLEICEMLKQNKASKIAATKAALCLI